MESAQQISRSLRIFYSTFRVYTRKIGLILTILIPLIFILAVIVSAFNTEIFFSQIFIIIWEVMIINSIFFSVFSFLHNFKFDKQIKSYIDIGLPIDSTAGFKYSKNQITHSLSISYWVTLSSTISFFCYQVSKFYHNSTNETIHLFSDILLYVAIGLTLISLSIFLTLDIPATYKLEPGNLLSYYRPQIYPSAIDNILSDSAKLFLDPMTRYQFDDWKHDVEEKLNPEFEKGEKQQIKVERAIEKLLLLMYLKVKIPKMVTQEIFDQEIREIISSEHLDTFLTGEKSKLPFVLFEELIEKQRAEIPEVFILIDRLLVEITINPGRFEETDPFVELIIPDTHSSLDKPFKLFTYVLNLGIKSSRYRRITIEAVSSRELEPPYSKSRIDLDLPEIQILEKVSEIKNKPEKQRFSKETIDLIAYMLQVGDAAWFQFMPLKFGNHIVNITIEREEKQIFGTSANISVKLSKQLRIQQIFRRFTGISGVIIPAVRTLLVVPIF